MKLKRAQEDVGSVVLDRIQKESFKTMTKKRKVGEEGTVHVEELQSIQEFVDFLIGERSDATPFIVALETLTRLFRCDLDIRKAMR